jgi:hypothetical protein
MIPVVRDRKPSVRRNDLWVFAHWRSDRFGLRDAWRCAEVTSFGLSLHCGYPFPSP